MALRICGLCSVFIYSVRLVCEWVSADTYFQGTSPLRDHVRSPLHCVSPRNALSFQRSLTLVPPPEIKAIKEGIFNGERYSRD